MNPVQKSLWFIESHLGGEIGLADIATFSGVSRYHLLRAFGEATGHSVMSYVRARRLTEAARCLAAGAPDILTVALNAGYGSHEAFTRAFRDHFGLTPDALRSRGQTDDIKLTEVIEMDETPTAILEVPRFESGRTLLIVGLTERYTFETNRGIPSQWQRFLPYGGNIPGQVGKMTYGLCCNSDSAGHFDYVTGVEVSAFTDMPGEFARLRIPARQYIVFSHRDHISTMRATVYAIWNKYLPESGHQIADAPDFELYGEDFDPRNGNGSVEIWLPIAT